LNDNTNRKLAVILHADVVDSTLLVQLDETIAHRRMRDAFVALTECVETHNGIAHEIRGDALVAEFARASDAIAAAVTFQSNVDAKPNTENDICPQLRIGIAMGEVVIADATITGTGVILAQRLEQLACAGGVCIQGAVYDTIPRRLPFSYDSLGEQQLKGFEEPIKAYLVRPESGETSVVKTPDEPSLKSGGKPSIAVLPFVNMSGDAEQEYFSDGISEDIITELSRFPTLAVIARHSAFAFKGQNVKLKQIASQLNVQYVVEGSIRRAGNRVRITAQLIEADTGKQIWAERYDRDLEDIFAVQDEVSRSIVAVLPGRVAQDLLTRTARTPPSSMQAYELILRGKQHYYLLNAEDLKQSRQLFEMAVAVDPLYARGHAHLADTHVSESVLGYANSAAPALVSARTAVRLDNSDNYCKSMLGWAYIVNGMWGDAETQFDKLLAKSMSDVDSLAWTGEALTLLGRCEEGRDLILDAMQLDPLHPSLYEWILGENAFFAKRYDEVVRILTGSALLNSLAYAYLACAQVQLGNLQDAANARQTFIRLRRADLHDDTVDDGPDAAIVLASGFRNNFRDASDWHNFCKLLKATP
jgi:adenylate cyclase